MSAQAVLTAEVVEQEELEMQRRQKAEEERAKVMAKEFRQRRDFDEQKDKRINKLNFLLKQTSTYSSFLENQLLASMKEEEEEAQPNKRRKITDEEREDKNDEKEKKTAIFQQPALVTGGKLRQYQLDGVQWLVSLYENGINGILGDEMGLGKTIQTISFLSHIKQNGVHGPFLVVGPLNTLNNWVREFRKFTPSISVVLYHGTKPQREELRKTQFRRLRKKKGRKESDDSDLPVIITSYEIIIKDASFLRRFDWKIIVVDEGHRLKNKDCVLIRELMQYKSSNRLLLSGTPLQNNLKELWSLLHFLLPDIFNSIEDFESWFDFLEITNHGQTDEIIQRQQSEDFVNKLHCILKPFLLRRVKSDVEDTLPPKKEIILYSHLTATQREYYSALLKERTDIDQHGRGAMKRLLEEKGLEKNQSSSASMSLQSIVMQLRKVCNHPYLFGEARNADGEFETGQDLVDSCGKMVLLDKMLPRLKEGGHKVLLFSQMTQLLDIFEDYCNFKDLRYCRLDGTTPQEERVKQMDMFNEDKDVFVFLLSTKAGGVGVNLIAADTVIFYDSDWNPHQDLQAQDRCHRIGQTRPVVIYRLVTRPSVEERIIERANSKRKLDRVVIQRGVYKGRASVGKDTSISTSELKEILEQEILSHQERAQHTVLCEEELALVLDRTDMLSVKQGRGFKTIQQHDARFGGQTAKKPALAAETPVLAQSSTATATTTNPPTTAPAASSTATTLES